MNSSVREALRVLIVDDEPLIRLSLAEYLDDDGFRVSQAEDGKSTLKALAENPFDVMILDLRLPDMDSEDLIRKARELRPNLKLLIYTGSTVDREAFEALGIESEQIFQKPQVNLDLLTEAIRNVARSGPC